MDGDGNHHLTFLYQHDHHFCGQRVNGVLRQEFKNKIKEAMANDPRAKYGKVGIWIGNFECENVYIFKVYDKIERNYLSKIEDPNLKEEMTMGAPDGLDSKTTLRTACSAATSLPTAPRCHEDIDLGKIPYGENGENCQKFLIGRHQQPGENKDIIILGTKKTVRQFCLSPFKSCDGTFSIAPK